MFGEEEISGDAGPVRKVQGPSPKTRSLCPRWCINGHWLPDGLPAAAGAWAAAGGFCAHGGSTGSDLGGADCCPHGGAAIDPEWLLLPQEPNPQSSAAAALWAGPQLT